MYFSWNQNRDIFFWQKAKTKRDPKKDKGRLSAIHGDYRRYLGVNISILNQPTTPLQPINPKYKKIYKFKYKYKNVNISIPNPSTSSK